MMLGGQAINNVPPHPKMTATASNVSKQCQRAEPEAKGRNYGNEILQHDRKSFVIPTAVQK